jgi:signal transduction histidine kinase/ActR/RegA family two-component response regulator
MPVYAQGVATSTVQNRREAVAGYVFSPFRADDLLSGIIEGRQTPLIDYEVYDGEAVAPAGLLHASSRDEAASRDRLETTHRFDVAGRTWTMVFQAPQNFSGSPRWLAPVTLTTGLLVAFALFRVTQTQVRGREDAERHAAELRASEEALRESEARLRRLVVLEREARATAQAADRAKDEFLATLSHELRTPLNAMLGWLSMLRSGKVREDRRSQALEIIERNARTQARLIEDLLDVSRIITGKVRLELHPVQLGPVASTVLEGLRPGAEAKGVRLHGTIARDPGLVMGDAARLQQVLWNLVANAIKFTPPGGEVSLEVEERDGELELRVRDTGVGIDPEFLPHVFERFRQADSSTTRTHSGVGLGLSIVRHLLELHGGRITAQSDGPGCGALFVARLPLAARAGKGIADARTESPAILDGVRVLVVEDDDDTREMLAVSLGASGAAVDSAASADEALQLLRERGVDVVVSDIGMPRIDGYALIRRIRQLPDPVGRVPAIALTAYARPEDRQQAIDAGYQVHLSKPVELASLQASVASLARRAEAQ